MNKLPKDFSRLMCITLQWILDCDLDRNLKWTLPEKFDLSAKPNLMYALWVTVWNMILSRVSMRPDILYAMRVLNP